MARAPCARLRSSTSLKRSPGRGVRRCLTSAAAPRPGTPPTLRSSSCDRRVRRPSPGSAPAGGRRAPAPTSSGPAERRRSSCRRSTRPRSGPPRPSMTRRLSGPPGSACPGPRASEARVALAADSGVGALGVPAEKVLDRAHGGLSVHPSRPFPLHPSARRPHRSRRFGRPAPPRRHQARPHAARRGAACGSGCAGRAAACLRRARTRVEYGVPCQTLPPTSGHSPGTRTWTRCRIGRRSCS